VAQPEQACSRHDRDVCRCQAEAPRHVKGSAQ
jgi:hypothetical protein